VWIGYLQWTSQHGFPWPQDPVLKPSDTIRCMDAILDLSDPEHPKEPEWPAVDFIVSNPPFLGSRLIVRSLGQGYLSGLRELYEKRLGGRPDLCCYFFEKARKLVHDRKCQRAGLLATQGIRGGTNRNVLKAIKQTGDIFFAVSDREWILDGASVHVSLVGFDDGTETARCINGQSAGRINADLTSGVDVTVAAELLENRSLSFQGGIKWGDFDLPGDDALPLLRSGGNPNVLPNSDVLLPYINASAITGSAPGTWIIDFGERTEEQAAGYQELFERVRQCVRPRRLEATQAEARRVWWSHWRRRGELYSAIRGASRFLVTPRVSKHRFFVWWSAPAYIDSAVVAVARSDDYFFGILGSHVHEVWARKQGTQLRERESGFRYTPTTCFETFPFPWSPRQEPAGDARVEAIAEAAKELERLRSNWLNPPEWTREEVLEFPGSADGPWARYLHDSDDRGIGTVRYPRTVPKDAECAAKLKARTLTNLYNERPTWLALAHEKLDAAVFAAYGWGPAMSDDHLLESLLALNLERAG